MFDLVIDEGPGWAQKYSLGEDVEFRIEGNFIVVSTPAIGTLAVFPSDRLVKLTRRGHISAE